ncbi:hypothetical protein APA30_32380 [Pseudomonas aeruginosa]|nr:hypothetical protein APA30_32380 [Pseudomonas aeruginosa]OPE08289.1 hypothetical protein APA54_32350 [Pseudomonas aeruginosa]
MLRFYTVWAGSSPSLPDGSNPSAAIVQSASDVQCSRLLKTTAATLLRDRASDLVQLWKVARVGGS